MYFFGCHLLPPFATICHPKWPQKSKLHCNTFHLPPLGALCDHPELTYCPLKKPNERTDNKGTTDNDEGAFNIDSSWSYVLLHKSTLWMGHAKLCVAPSPQCGGPAIPLQVPWSHQNLLLKALCHLFNLLLVDKNNWRLLNINIDFKFPRLNFIIFKRGLVL